MSACMWLLMHVHVGCRDVKVTAGGKARPAARDGVEQELSVLAGGWLDKHKQARQHLYSLC